MVPLHDVRSFSRVRGAGALILLLSLAGCGDPQAGTLGASTKADKDVVKSQMLNPYAAAGEVPQGKPGKRDRSPQIKGSKGGFRDARP